MTQKLVTRTNFAGIAGVNPSTVTKLCAMGLKAAAVGKRIDVAHPDVVAYLKKRAEIKPPPPAVGIDPLYEKAVAACQAAGKVSITMLRKELGVGATRATRIVQVIKASGVRLDGSIPPPTQNTPLSEAEPPGPHVLPEHIESFRDWTLQQITDQFGTDVQFLEFLKATKAICDIAEKDLKNAKTRGELVSREVVKVGVIDPINSAHIKLLTDGARSIAVRSMAMAAAEHSAKEIETYIAGAIGKFIKPVKAKVARALRNA